MKKLYFYILFIAVCFIPFSARAEVVLQQINSGWSGSDHFIQIQQFIPNSTNLYKITIPHYGLGSSGWSGSMLICQGLPDVSTNEKKAETQTCTGLNKIIIATTTAVWTKYPQGQAVSTDFVFNKLISSNTPHYIVLNLGGYFFIGGNNSNYFFNGFTNNYYSSSNGSSNNLSILNRSLAFSLYSDNSSPSVGVQVYYPAGLTNFFIDKNVAFSGNIINGVSLTVTAKNGSTTKTIYQENYSNPNFTAKAYNFNSLLSNGSNIISYYVQNAQIAGNAQFVSSSTVFVNSTSTSLNSNLAKQSLDDFYYQFNSFGTSTAYLKTVGEQIDDDCGTSVSTSLFDIDFSRFFCSIGASVKYMFLPDTDYIKYNLGTLLVDMRSAFPFNLFTSSLDSVIIASIMSEQADLNTYSITLPIAGKQATFDLFKKEFVLDRWSTQISIFRQLLTYLLYLSFVYYLINKFVPNSRSLSDEINKENK